MLAVQAQGVIEARVKRGQRAAVKDEGTMLGDPRLFVIDGRVGFADRASGVADTRLPLLVV